ncbi:MAG: general secretion pathway protein GspK [Desulfobacterales bacterium]|nr:general secretion pathway protein GspK [Desulfobacterales bacterium]
MAMDSQDQRTKGIRRIFSRLACQRGIALLVTLSVMAVLVPATLELNRYVRTSVTKTSAAKERLALSYMADSGIEAAMALLIADKGQSDADSLAEDWANPEKLALLSAAIPFARGNVTIRIADEKSRIQVNALVDFPESRAFNEPQRQLWDRILRGLSMGSDFYRDLDATMVINSLKDWLDSGDEEAITGLSGAESDYYETLDPPYQSRNGPVMITDELARVRGLNRAYLYGAQEIPGIADFLTPFGISPEAGNALIYDGKININTASLPVLAAMLPVESTDLAQAIFEYRRTAIDDDLLDLFTDPEWYRSAPGCADLEIDPALITVSSHLFRVESNASIDSRQLTVTAVIRRVQDSRSGQWKAEILRRTTQ